MVGVAACENSTVDVILHCVMFLPDVKISEICLLAKRNLYKHY